MTGTIQFVVGTSFECDFEGRHIEGIVRVEGNAQADVTYCRATRDTPSDFEVDNVEILDMRLVEFEDLNVEVENEDALYEHLCENKLIDGDVEEEISTEYGYSDWDCEDPEDRFVEDEYDSYCDSLL